MKIRFTFILLLFFNFIVAQNLNHRTFDVFDENQDLLSHPFSGGMDVPMFFEVDLNNDNVQDLYVFDLTSHNHMTFLNTGSKYEFTPIYAQNFPEYKNWLSIKDYNADGAPDIFAYDFDISESGVVVYNGYYQNNQLHFAQQNTVYSEHNYLPCYDVDENLSILKISATIHPSFDDIDGDGDIDIVSFLTNEKNFIYYQNRSVENGWGTDSLYFVVVDSCFGGAYEDGDNIALALADDINGCIEYQFQNPSEQSFKTNTVHGGYAILTLDNNGDGDKDLLFTDASFFKMNMLSNGGNANNAHFVAQDTMFPNNSLPVKTIIPLGFYFDVTFDGVKDLLVSSKYSSIDADANTFLYENRGTSDAPVFEFLEENWSVNNSIDYGKLSHPTFTDFDQDGLIDMVVASTFVRVNQEEIASRLFLYKNIGTINQPEFSLVDLDWLGLSSYNSYWLRPTFGDLDNDGDEDLLLGDADGRLIYLENNAGQGMPYTFENPIYEYMDLGVEYALGPTLSPQIIDVDDDGYKDLIAGSRYGFIYYFKNLSTDNTPTFNPDPDAAPNIKQLGNVSVGINATSVPTMVEIDGEKILFIGSKMGGVLKFDNITNNLEGTFNLISEDVFENKLPIGEYASPFLLDLDRNGYLNLFVGNYRGGLTSWDTNEYIGNEIVSNHNHQVTDINVFPNPATNLIQFTIPEKIEKFSIYNAIGQLVQKNNDDIRHLSTGMYIVVVETLNEKYTGKFIKE